VRERSEEEKWKGRGGRCERGGKKKELKKLLFDDDNYEPMGSLQMKFSVL
jgi:hypothetical protein